MYARLKNQTLQWPYTLDDLRSEESGTSFPTQITNDLLAEFGVVSVAVQPPPETDHSQQAVKLDPELIDDQWVQQWQVVDLSSEELAVRATQLAALIRSDRDQRLQKCDWTELPSVRQKHTAAWADAWDQYRELLRDVPNQQDFPWQVQWPQAPDQ